MPSTHDLDPDTDDSNQTNDTINAVDILAQCREQISKSATSASEATNQESNRAEKLAFERKAKAIKMYGDELDLELLHLVSPIHPSTFSQSFSPRTTPSINTPTNSTPPPTDPNPKHQNLLIQLLAPNKKTRIAAPRRTLIPARSKICPG